MFKWKVEEDKYESEQIRYYLTQGDSCGIRFKPVNPDTGEVINRNRIEQIVFKLYKNDNTRECIFHKAFVYTEEEGDVEGEGWWTFYILRSENTFPVDKYKYEIEVTLDGGFVNTPNQWFFHITEQAVCEHNGD